MASQSDSSLPQEVLRTWYQLSLELVRHTPTYSPPVASRALGYLGVTAFEAVASGSDELQSLAGQLNGLSAVPQRGTGKTYDEAAIVQAAMAAAVKNLFSNTGPTGQHAMASLEEKLRGEVSKDCLPMSWRAAKPMARRSRRTYWRGRRTMAARSSKTWVFRLSTS